MRASYKLAVSIAICAAISRSAMAIDQPVDLAPLYADITASYPGVEVIVPFVTGSDVNFDGIPESATIKLRIFTPGTATTAQVFRYATPGRVVSLPNIPCVSPLRTVWQFNTKPLRDGKMVAVAYDYKVICIENDGFFSQKYSPKTAVYVADASVSNGIAWALAYDRPLAGFNLVEDQNGNGFKEVSVVTQWLEPPATAYSEIRDLATRAIINKGAFTTID